MFLFVFILNYSSVYVVPFCFYLYQLVLLASCLAAVGAVSLSIAQLFVGEVVEVCFGLLKIQVKFLIN